MKADYFKRSVDSLQGIYSIIIALAIAQAINTTFISNGALKTTHEILLILPQFLTFVVTIVPFFHGMNRHLDRCYLSQNSNPIEGALLFDFFVFFMEAMVLFSFAGTLSSGSLQCFLILAILLFFDSLWSIISYWIHYKKFTRGPIVWCIINVITIVLLIFLYFHQYFQPEIKPWLFFIIAFCRTVSDYYFCWPFYFPETE